MPKLPTHYDTLHVSRDAPIEVIRSAYRSLARKYHPDSGGSRESDAAMQALNAAYEALSNPLTRAEHDRWIDAQLWSDPAEAPTIDLEPDDFFESRPQRRVAPPSAPRAFLNVFLILCYAVTTFSLLLVPGARVLGVLMLIAGWLYYRSQHSR